MRQLSPVIALVLVLTSAAAARAQDPEIPPLPKPPMTLFVVDVRGALSAMKQDATVATALQVNSTDLPQRGLGFVVGAHVYPIRKGSFALGLGGEMLRVSGSNTVQATTEDGEDGPTITARWSQVSPQVSLNFGARDGWSYATVGLGRAKLTIERDDAPQADPESSVGVLNYGGGARWFIKKHLAFTLDLRYYSINAQEATAGRIATPKMRVRVFSGGISIR